MTSMIRYFMQGAMLLAVTPLLLGTTFVVREKGVEVGQYIENDNKDEVQYIDSDDLLSSKGNKKAYLEVLERERKRLNLKQEELIQEKERIKSLRDQGRQIDAETIEAFQAQEYAETVERDTHRIQRAKERRQSWGIQRGMSISQVQEIAADRGIHHYHKYQQRYERRRLHPLQLDLVYEYRFKTENYTHSKKVFFDSYTQHVSKVLHQATPRR